MVGGKWIAENKTRPGAYINVKTDITENSVSERGTVLMPLARSWGLKKFVSVNAESDFLQLLGYSLADAALLPLRECLKRAETVKVWSLNNGTKAEGVSGAVTIKAVCGGTRGNDLSVSFVQNTENGTDCTVTTMLDGVVMDIQAADVLSELQDNGFVEFSGSGDIPSNVTVKLSGGTDGTVQAADYNDFFEAAKVEDFDVMAVDSEDPTVKAAVTSCMKDLRENEGRNVQAVLADYAAADYEGVISVKNGVVLTDGTVLDKYKAVYWVAGATAGAAVNESNTYSLYEGSSGVDIRYLNSDVVAALKEGSFVFTQTVKGAVVEQDINTLSSFSGDKGSIIRKNRVLRVLDTLVSDIQQIFNEYFLGKVNNDADGRNLFKAQILSYLENLQAMSAITGLDKNNDVVIAAGRDADSITVNLAVMPVDSIEKLYMTVVVG
ncbi:MAG: phage tail sheath family protein [Bacillota bacterium]|jgi:hypothetical protein